MRAQSFRLDSACPFPVSWSRPRKVRGAKVRKSVNVPRSPHNSWRKISQKDEMEARSGRGK